MIWQLEVDTALQKELETLLKCPVVFQNPNVLTTKETYPVISINLYDQKVNYQMKDHNSRYIDKGTTTATIQNKPDYYDFYYQIDIWAKKPKDINTLTGLLVANKPPRSILNVLDTQEDIIYPLNMTFLYFKNLDIVKGEDTYYRRCYSYKVSVPIINSPKESTIMADGLQFTTTHK